MEKPLKVAVVIVNYELPQDTITCLQSLAESSIEHLHILVIDNGSKDDSISQIRTAFKDVEILALPTNTGFVGGYNAGIERALASDVSHIFLLNNDTTVDPSSLQFLLNSPWDIAVPKILLMAKPATIWSAGARWRHFPPSVVMNGYLKMDDGSYDEQHPLEFATGCALMVKRHVFESIGGFDNEFENYTEDYDFFYRAGKAGFSSGYIPQARIYHKVSATIGADSPEKWWYMGRNTVLFYRKENRLPAWKLWCQLTWVLIRESIKGNVGLMPAYWHGIQSGRRLLRR